MLIDINDIKNGMTVIIEGNLYQIVEFLHVKPGKGSAFMKTKLKNLRTGGTVEKTFNTNVKFEKANLTRTLSFLVVKDTTLKSFIQGIYYGLGKMAKKNKYIQYSVIQFFRARL